MKVRVFDFRREVEGRKEGKMRKANIEELSKHSEKSESVCVYVCVRERGRRSDGLSAPQAESMEGCPARRTTLWVT